MKRFALPTAALLLVLFGCGRNESAPSVAAKPKLKPQVTDTAPKDDGVMPTGQVLGDPCAYFTVADATAAFGQPMQAGAQSNNACEIMSVDRSGNAVTLNYRITDSPVMYEAMSRGGAQLSGLGDKAVWATSAKQLLIVKGKRELQLAIIGLGFVDDAKVRPKAEEIAKKIVEKM